MAQISKVQKDGWTIEGFLEPLDEDSYDSYVALKRLLGTSHVHKTPTDRLYCYSLATGDDWHGILVKQEGKKSSYIPFALDVSYSELKKIVMKKFGIRMPN